MSDEERRMLRAKQEGVLFQTAASAPYLGQTVETDAGKLRNFAGLGYLGLELRPELVEGTLAATTKFGTQFPFPRAMLGCALYRDLEARLEAITGREVFIGASTTLAHLAALPRLVEEHDCVLVEEGAHSSVHMAAKLLAAPVQLVHLEGQLEEFCRTLSELASKHSKVWLLLDGIASGTGRIAPFAALIELMTRFPQLHLYVDEAHATSWTGTFGRGLALELDVDPTRITAVLSLNKGFGAAGAAVALPTNVQLGRVASGATAMFTGAIQPPLLGAALASADFHLSCQLPQLQSDLMAKIRRVISTASTLGIPLLDEAETPLFFVHVGDPELTFRLVKDLAKSGFYVCGVVPPVVPSVFSGIRFTVSVHNHPTDIDEFLSQLANGCRRLSLSLPSSSP